MRIIFILFLLLNVLQAQSINVAVAANVSYAMDALKAAFSRHYPHIKVQITLGGSGKLTAQIKNGAPYDVFMSANRHYPDTLFKEGFALTPTQTYAQGSLAMLSLHPRDFSKGIAIVTDQNIKRIAIANPKTAPYGKASVEALKNAHLFHKVKNKFIYGESISQTVTYTVTAADLGFIATSALYSPKLKYFQKGRNWVEVDSKLYRPIAQGIVLLKHAKNNASAKDFYNFILSKEAQTIFQKYGYTTP